MATPDIRIRISGEGGAAVVAALDAIANKAASVGKKAAAGFNPLNVALGGAKHMVGAMVAAFSVHKLIEFGKEAAMAGREIQLMTERVGASATHLSALTYAARMADIDMSMVQRSMAMLARNLDIGAVSGNNATKALQRLGLSAKGFSGKDAVEQLELIGKAMAGLKDSSVKTALSMQLFSRAGFTMVPVLNMLGREGIDGLEKKLRRLGLLMDHETVVALAGLTESFKTLNLAGKGLATQFMAGFAAPALTAVNHLTEGVEGTTTGAYRAGRAWGRFLNILVGGIGIITSLWHGLNELLGALATSLADAFVAAIFLDWNDVGQFFRSLGQRAKKAFWDGWHGVRDNAMLAFGKDDKPHVPEAGTGDPGDAEVESAKEHAAALDRILRARIASELTIIRTGLKAEDEARRDAYDHGTMALNDYYDGRRRILKREMVAEREAIRKERALLSSPPDISQQVAALALLKKKRDELAASPARPAWLTPSFGAPPVSPLPSGGAFTPLAAPKPEAAMQTTEQRTAALVAANAAIASSEGALAAAQEARQAEKSVALEALANRERELDAEKMARNGDITTSEANDIQKLADGSLDTRRRILEANGQVHAAKMIEIEQEIRAEARRIGADVGNPSVEQQKALDALRAALNNQLAMEERSLAFAAQEAEYASERAAIEADMVSTFGAQWNGEARLLALDKQRVTELLKVALANRAAAVTPLQIADAQALVDKYVRLNAELNRAGVEEAKFARGLKDIAQSGIADALMIMTSETQTFGEAMQAVALQVVQAIRQMIAELIALQIMQAITGFGGGGRVATAGPGTTEIVGSPTVWASGGFIRGPGTGTSDSIPAWLSRGEYVVRSAVVQQPGVLGMLELLNAGMAHPRDLGLRGRGYAAGGVVRGTDSKAEGPSESLLMVGLDQGLILKSLETPQGQRLVIKALANHPRAARRAQGLG